MSQSLTRFILLIHLFVYLPEEFLKTHDILLQFMDFKNIQMMVSQWAFAICMKMSNLPQEHC